MKRKLQFDTAFGSYSIIDLVGEGGSGKVFKVQDKSGDTYALKYLNPGKITTGKLKRFKNELYFCLKKEHPNIVKILDWGYNVEDDTNCPFYVMPYYPVTLRKIMDKGIPHDRVLPYFSQILDGVEAAHLVSTWHRDLKPENILCDEPSGVLVIADWGIAHFAEDILQTLVVTRPHERFANFQYAAPEQRSRSGNIDHRADIYALGMILNEMFTGELLLGTGYKRIASINATYEYLDDLVELMVRQSASDRINSIDQIKQQLIARQNEFITRQKISELKKQVIPQSALDDPLVNDPVSLIGLDYDGTNLILKLNHDVSKYPHWIPTFKSIGNYSAILGKDPSRFTFVNDKALIRAEEHDVQQLVKYFKDYLVRTTKDYEKKLLGFQRRKEAEDRHRLEAQIEVEEKRQRILKNIKI
jgi:serine/threonine protein kinase